MIALTCPTTAIAQRDGPPRGGIASAAPAARSPATSAAATLSLPVEVDRRRLPSVTAEVTLSEVLAVSPAGLAEALGGMIAEETAAALRNLGAGLVPVDQVRATGVNVELDAATLSLAVTVSQAARGNQVFSPFETEAFEGRERVQASEFAFGLTGALLASNRFDGAADPDVGLGLAGFTNMGGVDGINVLFGGDVSFTGDADFFRRDRIVAFKDDPARATRYSAGDLSPLQARFAGQIDILGLSYERDYEAIQPTRNVRPVGRRSFVLERRSTVEVYVNGGLVQTFLAEPGPIDIRDIPTVGLNNNVSIVVQDTLGRRELESFSLGNDISLLAAGFSEFSAAVGVLRDADGFGLRYSNDPVASLYYSSGISQKLTLSGHAVLAESVQNIGASAAVAAIGGVALAETAASRAEGVGTGFVLGLSYRGDPLGLTERNGSLNLRADYQTRKFTLPSDLGLQNIQFDLAADYSFDINERTTVNFGASYLKRYGREGTDAGIFTGVQYRLGLFAISATARHIERDFGRSDTGVLITLTRLFRNRLTATASHDSASESSRFDVRQRRDLRLPEVEWAVRGTRTPQETELGGNFRYATSRFDSEVDVVKIRRDGGGGRNDSATGQLRLQTGIAYADGRFAIGRDPAQGFAIVSRHPSLQNARLAVSAGTVGRELAYADALGPAVAPIFGAFRPQEISVNAIGGPPGYDIGAGAYVLEPGARSGFAIEVGGIDYRVVLTTLSDDTGRPLSLMTGTLRNVATGETSTFFTNRNGRAAFNNLKPGAYRAKVDNSDLGFDFTVSEDGPALTNLGAVTLEPEP